MKIKSKLTLGIGLLFTMIILLSVVGGKYINALKNDTENILTANYNTLEFSRVMMLSLDDAIEHKDALTTFEINLEKQRKNVTEIGEQELTDALSKHFDQLKSNPDDHVIKSVIRNDLSDIMQLNMQAIQRKSGIAENTARTATFWIAVTSTFSLLIALTFLINFPGSIANPIKELTSGIKGIAQKNYKERLSFSRNDEFGEVASAFNSMAAKLEEYESSTLSKILFEKKRIETLINNMHDPIIGLDENKKILFANEAAFRVFSLKSEALIGQLATDVSVTNDLMRTLTQDLLLSDSDLRKAKQEPLKIYADGKESYFEKEIISVQTIATGETTAKNIGDVIILKNVTPFKELDFAKTNFIATVSHELKTPISSILMSLKLLEDDRVGKVNEDQKQLLKNIGEDSGRLLKIIGELLNLTQVETGKIQLNLQPTNPTEIIQYAIAANKIQADNKKIAIEIRCPEMVPLVKADTEKTAWVLTNLLSNAIRYSYENSKVVLTITPSKDSVEFSVQDFGKGIESKYSDKIFDRYFRIPGNDKEGTGLGLAISKEFIEAQGGKIWLKSAFAEGSTFSFVLNC